MGKKDSGFTKAQANSLCKDRKYSPCESEKNSQLNSHFFIERVGRNFN